MCNPIDFECSDSGSPRDAANLSTISCSKLFEADACWKEKQKKFRTKIARVLLIEYELITKLNFRFENCILSFFSGERKHRNRKKKKKKKKKKTHSVTSGVGHLARATPQNCSTTKAMERRAPNVNIIFADENLSKKTILIESKRTNGQYEQCRTRATESAGGNAYRTYADRSRSRRRSRARARQTPLADAAAAARIATPARLACTCRPANAYYALHTCHTCTACRYSASVA